MKRLPFADLITPISLSSFEDQYWEKKHLHVSRDNPNYYHELLTLKDIDFIINSVNPRYAKAVKQDQTVTPAGFQVSDDIEILMESFNQGASLIFNSLDKSWGPLKQLCFETYKAIPICKSVFANVYLAPKNSQAFDRHTDYQDTLILQVDGSKVWRIYETPYKFPLDQHQCSHADSLLSDVNLIEEIQVKAGDLLYVPRGTPHEVVTTNQQSLHITLSIVSVTYYDIVSKLCSLIKEDSIQARMSIPWNFFRESKDFSKVRNLMQSVTPTQLEKAIADYINGASGKSMATYESYFLNHHLIDNLQPESRLILRDGANYSTKVIGDRLIIETKYNELEIDINGVDFDYILTNGTFTAAQLPGLDEVADKLEFMRDLMRVGIVNFA